MANLIAFVHQAGDAYGVSFPDFPGVAVGGRSPEDALTRSRDALAAHFEALIEEGLPIPEPSNIITGPMEPDVFAIARVDVDFPSRAQRVNITIDINLLAQIDRAASRSGETRSGFLAQAARDRLTKVA